MSRVKKSHAICYFFGTLRDINQRISHKGLEEKYQQLQTKCMETDKRWIFMQGREMSGGGRRELGRAGAGGSLVGRALRLVGREQSSLNRAELKLFIRAERSSLTIIKRIARKLPLSQQNKKMEATERYSTHNESVVVLVTKPASPQSLRLPLQSSDCLSNLKLLT